jgi:hypothetical protein
MGVLKIKLKFIFFKDNKENQNSPNTPTFKTQHCPQC